MVEVYIRTGCSISLSPKVTKFLHCVRRSPKGRGLWMRLGSGAPSRRMRLARRATRKPHSIYMRSRLLLGEAAISSIIELTYPSYFIVHSIAEPLYIYNPSLEPRDVAATAPGVRPDVVHTVLAIRRVWL